MSMDHGLIGAIDVRDDGAEWHLYLVAIVRSRDEARAVKLAALEGVEFEPKSQKTVPLGDGTRTPTVDDHEAARRASTS